MNKYEIITLIISTLTPVVIVVLGYWFNLRLKQFDIATQRQRDLEQDLQKKQKEELERRHEPHIEFTLDANFFGPQKGNYLAEFIIYAHNKSLVQHKFKKIIFRVRGIKKDEELCIWEGHAPRLKFPHEIIDPKKTDFIPKKWNFIFVEPGVKQPIDFATSIDADFAYILAHAEFYYDEHTPHTIERVFEIGA